MCKGVTHSPRCILLANMVLAGSGKSNLLEALQFAAGASATELRVKTLKELCNNSGADQVAALHPSLSHAQDLQALPFS